MKLDIRKITTLYDGYFFKSQTEFPFIAFQRAEIKRDMVYIYFYEKDTSDRPRAESKQTRRDVRIIPLNQCRIEAEEWEWKGN